MANRKPLRPKKDKAPKKKPSASNGEGLSQDEHGQAWERGEGVETAVNESEQDEGQEESQDDDQDD